MDKRSIFYIIGSLFGLTGIALGAFGAHSLKAQISAEMLSVFETGVRYQMYHAFALIVAAWFLDVRQNRRFEVAAWLFVAGVVLFSGSLYVLAISGITSIGIVTPLGGLAFLGGWLSLVLGFLKKE